jgi:hypothetical protein
MEFELIRNIDIKDPKTWEDKVFLTMDTDWSNDDVLSYVLDMLEEKNIKATIFLTHDTSLITRIRKNPDIELGIHPNFNFLLEGDFRYGRNIPEVMSYYHNIVPDAVSARSHYLTQSTSVLSEYLKHGIANDCNTFIPFTSGITLKPFRFFDGLKRIPFFWEDDTNLYLGAEWNLETLLSHPGLRVFNFHPNFIFLNCETYERYSDNKQFLSNTPKLLQFRNNESFGTSDFFNLLLNH